MIINWQKNLVRRCTRLRFFYLDYFKYMYVSWVMRVFIVPVPVVEFVLIVQTMSYIKYDLPEGPATHLCMVLLVCRSYEKKPDFAGPPRWFWVALDLVIESQWYGSWRNHQIPPGSWGPQHQCLFTVNKKTAQDSFLCRNCATIAKSNWRV